MKSIFNLFLLFIFSNLLVNACFSSQTMALNSVELTNQLRPGMHYDEVREILGDPKSTFFQDDKWVARWNLQEMWKGYVPYDFVFNPDNQTLLSWSENQKEFEKKQANLKTLADAVESSASPNGGANSVVPDFENNPELMKSFAGQYYSFSAVGGGQTGGTETKVMLCPDGTFRNQSESGYSGTGWGSASQGGSGGTWKITGNMNEGTLVTIGNNGSATTYKYSRCGNDCIYFGNNKFAYAGPPQCW